MALQAPQIVPKGGILMGILVEGNPPSKPATKANLDGWIFSAKAPNTWALDSTAPQPLIGEYVSLGRDAFIIVDLKTMMIVEITLGNVALALNNLEALLDQ